MFIHETKSNSSFLSRTRTHSNFINHVFMHIWVVMKLSSFGWTVVDT